MIGQSKIGALAKQLIGDTRKKQLIEHIQLIIHSDRGPSMKSKPVAILLSGLAVTTSHIRPHVSNDNPYLEAQSNTLKYCPQFPGMYGCIQDITWILPTVFSWYNNAHNHSSIGLMTPEQVKALLTKYRQNATKFFSALMRKPLNDLKARRQHPMHCPKRHG